MAFQVDPLALATHGVVKFSGSTDDLGLATFGVVVKDGAGPQPDPLVPHVRRTQLLSFLGRQRR